MEAMLQVVDQPCHQHWGHMGLSVSWGWITWEGISRRGYRWLMVCRVPTQTKTKVHTPSYCIRQNPVQIWFVNSTWTTRGNHKASGTKNLVACLQILQIHMLIFLLCRYSCWVGYVICPHLAKKKKRSAKQHVNTCFWITHLHRQTFSPFLHVFGQWVMQNECDLIIILTGHDPGYIYVLHVSRRTADCRMSTALVKKYVQHRKQREWAYFRISSENCTLVTRGISTARVCMFVVLLNTNTV